MVYTMYMPALGNIHGTSMVYTMDIPCEIFIGVPDAYDIAIIAIITF